MTSAERAEQKAALERLRRDAAFLAERFRLPLRAVDAESRRVRRRYGICYDDGSIKIRLHNVRSGELLKYSALVDTLCHELAHLRHFNHGYRFRRLYLSILGYAKRNDIYRPTPRLAPELQPVFREQPARAPSGPIQLELFGES